MADRGEDGELRAELRTLRARVDEQTALAKRTADSLRRLAESLVARKRGYEKLLSLNSFASYLLFTILLGGGFFLLYQSRVGDLVDAESAAVEARERARERARDLQDELDERRAAAERAGAFFELVEAGDAAGILAGYPELDGGFLTPTERAVFAEAVGEARAQVAGDREQTGLEAFERGDYARAASELFGALELAGEGARAAALRYYLGIALYREGEHERAARALELSLAGGAEGAGMTDARYYLAAALAELGEHERARAAYERFATDQPTSPRAPEAVEAAAALADDGG